MRCCSAGQIDDTQSLEREQRSIAGVFPEALRHTRVGSRGPTAAALNSSSDLLAVELQ
jgi:hypothetical protein